MKAVTDTSKVYEAELRVHHVKRPGFRITEMQISPTQECVAYNYGRIRFMLCPGPSALSCATRLKSALTPDRYLPSRRNDRIA